MGLKRVVLLSNRSLLAAGVQRLLQEADGLELAVVAAGTPEWAVEINRLSPQVIVLDSGDVSIGQGVITEILDEHPGTRVIALDLNRKGIDVYRMRRVLQTDLDGLLHTIQRQAPAASRRRRRTHGSEGRGVKA